MPKNPKDFMGMISVNKISLQTAIMSGVMDGSIDSRMAPPDFSEKKIVALPLTDMTWFVYFHSITDLDGNSRSGYRTVVTYKVGLVQKETGSNGFPWDAEGNCDGLSSLMALGVEVLDGSGTDVLRTLDGMLKCVAKACIRPCDLGSITSLSIPSNLQQTPGRPRRVLVHNDGFMRALKPKLRRLGIPEVDIADENLIGSMAAGFASSPLVSQGAGTFVEVYQDAEDEAYCNAIAAARTRNLEFDGYEDERRKPIGLWRPKLLGVPIDWYSRPPTEEELRAGYRERMLWGWRTNMELAVERNDAAKISDIAMRHPRDQVRALVEMRLLLGTAAEKGLLRSCEALLEPHPKGAGASVDGVMSRDNKQQWRAMQKATGDGGATQSNTPLNRACQRGNTAIVALLLEKGADPNLVNAVEGAGPLYYAVVHAHKDCVRHLLKGGPGGRADIYLQAKNGLSAFILAKLMVKETGQTRFKSILSILEDVDSQKVTEEELEHLGGRCSACGTAGARKKCPCGAVEYCDKNCQADHWRAHKRDHRELMKDK